MKKVPKKEVEEKIKKFFLEIQSKTPNEIKKIKKLAMGHNISLKEFKNKFCKKCLMPYSGKERLRIKRRIKSIVCERCGYINRRRIKI